MKRGGTSTEAHSRWRLTRHRRHRCNLCRTIFDCSPCMHGWENGPPVFCSAACAATYQQAEREEAARLLTPSGVTKRVKRQIFSGTGTPMRGDA